MRSLVRPCNFESPADATEFGKHSYEISMLNEKLRQVSINYSHQIEALNEQQRHEYRQLVRTILLPWQAVLAVLTTLLYNCSSSEPMFLHRYTNHHSFHDHFKVSHIHAIRKFWSYTDNILTLASFTICIGAQLKTMHNARILTCDQLVDLLTVDRSNNNTSNKFLRGLT
ncbi:hypothetical protein niasHS_016275 [Heterodera schachtii]|uniref:Uncharacterized protein n=1 Tax=Heterodera schachtii TaxID=97005 RepID=A0ABD2I3N5_HETSC